MSGTHRTSGLGFSGALFLVFLALRLTDHIDWEWYWVASPLWTPIALLSAVAVSAAPIVWFSRRRRAKQHQHITPTTNDMRDLKARLGLKRKS